MQSRSDKIFEAHRTVDDVIFEGQRENGEGDPEQKENFIKKLPGRQKRKLAKLLTDYDCLKVNESN